VKPEKVLKLVNDYHLAAFGDPPIREDGKSSWQVFACRQSVNGHISASYATGDHGFGATFEEAVEDWARKKWPVKKKKATKRKRTIKKSHGKGTVSREAVRKAVRKVKAERDGS
jgi:hypothetical protein